MKMPPVSADKAMSYGSYGFDTFKNVFNYFLYEFIEPWARKLNALLSAIQMGSYLKKPRTFLSLHFAYL